MSGSSDDQATDLADDEPAADTRLQLVVIGQQAFASIDLPERGELVIGRGEQADVRLDESLVSRRHAILHVGAKLEIEDLDSVNGTRLRETPITGRVVLAPGDIISIGTTVLIVQPSAGAARPRRLWPHGYFEARLEDECARARRAGSVFAIARIQVEPGPGTDKVAEMLAGALRMADVLARYAPRDYEALLTDTDADDATAVIERLVARLQAGAVRARVGLALYPRDGRTPEALVAAVTAQVTKPSGAATAMPIVVEDPLMQRLHGLVRRVAAGNINVLVLGETGVGKEVIAEAIHRGSPRAARPFLRLNCAAFSETLLESELFGHEKGAFTGAIAAKPGLLETANGGTVLLDEVGELPLALQAKLLRVIDTPEVMRVGGLKTVPIDVRFIAATNRDLDAEITRGVFRQDLYFRLGGFTLEVPPLRQRAADIPGLATAFVAEAAQQAGRPPPSISIQSMNLLRGYSWPGNVRELRNMMERAVVLCGGNVIALEHLPVEKMRDTVAVHMPRRTVAEATMRTVTRPTMPDLGAPQPVAHEDAGLSAEELEDRERIVDALTRAAGNQSLACKLLGLSRSSLILRLERYRIARPRKGQTRG
jgi:two-component system, NtrC family, response regulator AtoC